MPQQKINQKKEIACAVENQSRWAQYIDHLYSKACLNKRAYISPSAAIKGLNKSCRTHPKEDFNVYQCRFCGLYHVGHKKDTR